VKGLKWGPQGTIKKTKRREALMNGRKK